MALHEKSLEERQKVHDTFRTTFSGGRIEMLPEVKELPRRILGRLLFRIALYNGFHPESDHSNGNFIFGGLTIFWEIIEEQSGFVLVIGVQEHGAAE